MTSQAEVVAALEALAPAALAESWDNIGWQLRCDDEPVTGILCAVDATDAVVDEAVGLGANLIVAHHPILYRPLRSLDVSNRVGGVLARALRSDTSIIAAHTNWDAAPDGISWALARCLDLEPQEPLQPSPLNSEAGFGVIAQSSNGLNAEELITRVRGQLGSPVHQWVGATTEHHRVALMGGSGARDIPLAVNRGATVYITADVRYHDAQEAESLGLSLLVVDHGASERPGMAYLGKLLSSRLNIPVHESRTPTSPWR